MQGASLSVVGLTELPSCPVCLERMVRYVLIYYIKIYVLIYIYTGTMAKEHEQ